MLKQGHVRKNWKKRWFKTVGDALYYFVNPSEGVPLGTIPLKGAQIEQKSDEGRHRFEIHCLGSSKSFLIEAATKPDVEDWIWTLSALIGDR